MSVKSMVALAATLIAIGLSSTATAQPEPLLGYRFGADQVTFRVPSSGCTDAASFRVDRAGHVITLVRTVPDACLLAMPWGVDVAFTWDALGLAAEPEGVRVANPVTTHGDFRSDPVSWTGAGLNHPGGSGVETLFGYTIDAESITFQVNSGGCTRPEHFRAELAGGRLTLIRVTPDYCEAYFPFGTDVTFSAAELGLGMEAIEGIFIANPLGTHVAWSGLAAPTTPAAPAVDTIGGASAAPDGTPVRLGGFLWGNGRSLFLCETILESMPPHCGEPAIPVDGMDPSQVPGGLSVLGDLSWSNWVVLTGTVRGGRLVEPTVVRE